MLRSSVLAGQQLVGWGKEETARFKRQSAAYAEAFKIAGSKIETLEVAGHHFDIVDELASTRSLVFKAALKLVEGL